MVVRESEVKRKSNYQKVSKQLIPHVRYIQNRSVNFCEVSSRDINSVVSGGIHYAIIPITFQKPAWATRDFGGRRLEVPPHDGRQDRSVT